MSKLTGIFVSLTTAAGPGSETDQHVYLGVVGTVGGREFALAVDDIDDFARGSLLTYSIGPAADMFGGHKPATADALLGKMTICLPNVTHVYLRKQGDATPEGDDAWRLASAFVYLISPTLTRVFVSSGPALLANEAGLQVWLAESSHGGQYLDTRLSTLGAAECPRAER